LTWSDFSGGVGLNTSLQGEASGKLDIGRMTLTAVPVVPAPAALPAGLALIGVVAARRRR